MKAYNPTETGDSEHVAPLMQFFELVHIGDMIQSVIQVYFDKEVVGSNGHPLSWPVLADKACICRRGTSIELTS